MDYVLSTDVYQIKLASLVSNVDKDVMVELYQPLIGANATILYLTLLKQKRNEDEENEYKLSHLLNILQFNTAQFLSARRMLEGVGLIRSYVNDIHQYIYVLYAPKNPKDFFDDVLFKGLLIQQIGEKETKKLAMAYKINLDIAQDYEEVSASFVDVFKPDYDDAAFKKTFKDSIVGHDEGRIRIDFNYDLFLKYLAENLHIVGLQMGKRDLKEVARYAMLFGFNEKHIAELVGAIYIHENTPHFDFADLKVMCEQEIRRDIQPVTKESNSAMKGSDPISEKCRLMETYAPAKYLKLLQNNTKVSQSDLMIVESLSKDYGFSGGVINAIVDYTLVKCDNKLNKNYCEKVAVSLARENVASAIDAMNFLNRFNSKKKPQIAGDNDEKAQQKPVKHATAKSISDDELSQIFAELDSRKKGGRK